MNSLLGGMIMLVVGTSSGMETVTHLRCEYLTNPPAIQTIVPRLSWCLSSPVRGASQTAYQIQVASSEKRLMGGVPDLWDSGKVQDSRMNQVVYAGTPLKSQQQCFWRVRVWDEKDQPSPWSSAATWGIGLMEPGDWPSDWISEPTPVPNDSPAHNGFHSAIATSAETEKWVMVDLEELQLLDSVILCPARPYDWVQDTPGFLFPLRYCVELSDTPDFNQAVVVVDKTETDVPSPAMEPQIHAFEPRPARYVRLRVTHLRDRGESNFGFALAEMMVMNGTRNLALNKPVTASDVIEFGGWSASRLVDGETQPNPGGQIPAQPAPFLRKEFQLTSSVKRALVYATAMGVYELYINGQRVGDQVLAPEWTDYHQRVQYQAFDVTALLHEGGNVVGTILGDGWCVGRIGMSQALAGKLRRVYQNKPAFRMQMVVEYADGSRGMFGTDESWSATLDGPIRSSDLLDGEVYDARHELVGWHKTGFDSSDWKPVEKVTLDGVQLVAQPNEPLRIMQTIQPVMIHAIAPGIQLVDMGQNMVGWLVEDPSEGGIGNHNCLSLW